MNGNAADERLVAADRLHGSAAPAGLRYQRVLQESPMSELKRSDNDYRSNQASHAATTPGIDESQPRQTLEMQRAMELWKAAREKSTDPYNSVGANAISPGAA
jgi:hypothetical protein